MTTLLHAALGSLGRERRDLRRARRFADNELLRLESAPPRLAWRSAELVAGAHRLELARELRRLVDAADPRYLPSASPLDRGAVRAEAAALLRLAAQLSDLAGPVTPRGVLLLERFLVDSGGALYASGAERGLGPALADVAAALRGRS